MLVVLGFLAFGLPALIGRDGSYTVAQEIPVIVATVVLYGFFLFRQMGPRATDFTEIDERVASARRDADAGSDGIRAILSAHRTEVLVRTGVLIVAVIPIVLLSHDMAALLDDGLGRLGAPAALAGVLIAAIVFLPESITAVRAALAGEIQRVINLCHGALVSTVGLTVPTVLVIGMLVGQDVVLAAAPPELLVLGATLVLTVTTFAARRVTAVHGAVHLAVFATYLLVLMR
jgi:Ca2+:H+ antiporter